MRRAIQLRKTLAYFNPICLEARALSERIRVPKGLDGVIVDTTSISMGYPEGRIIYRGYDLQELAERSTFEETAYLILHGRLPTANQLDSFAENLTIERSIPLELQQLFSKIPSGAHPMDIARAGISFLSLLDLEVDDSSKEANFRKALRLIAKTPTIIALSFRISRGLEFLEPKPTLKHAANFLYMLTGEIPDEFSSKIFELTLILYMDHDFNASAFTTRAVASTLSDIYGAVTAAFAALKGPLHGGANEQVMEMLNEIGDPPKAESWVKEALAKKQKVPGFGHRVYKKIDPRVPIAKPHFDELCRRRGENKWVQFAGIIEYVMRREKNLPPNIDFYTGPIYHILGIPRELYTPIFAASRVVGWCAHYIEQVENNRLIRPEAEYVGPTNLKYTLISERI